MGEAEFSLIFGIHAVVSQTGFQFELLLMFVSAMLRDLHFGLKFPTLDLGPRDFYFILWKMINSFLLRKWLRGLFHAQITPTQLGFITSDLASAECSPE